MKSFLFLHPLHILACRQDVGKGKACAYAATRLSGLKTALLVMAVCPFTPVHGQTNAADSATVADKTCRFKATQLIAPATLITIGSIGVCNGWFHHVNHNVRNGMSDWRKDKFFKADDYLQYLPVAANIGLGLTGVKARHPLRERVACTATAYLAMGIMVNVTKLAVGEKRPDSEARNSFPSGHTATAFMGAELVRKEYGGIAGACAYTLATGVAVMRLYNNRHWLNDVITGAGMGILSAKIGFWLLPWERRLLGWDKHGNGTTLLPIVNAHDGSFAMIFRTNI